jgi:Raf kinase inhibitor-like YbhB/YbcL family protein
MSRGIMPSVRLAAPLACLALAGCGGSAGPASAPPPAPRALAVSSPDFAAGGRIPAADTCDGAGRRPVLAWRGVPAGARELAVVVSDPDAGGFVHWTVFALAPGVRRLPARGLPAGALEGQNSFGHRGWGPPCPPKGDPAHRYRFDVYWLRRPSGLAAGAGPKAVYAALRGAAGGRGELVGRYAVARGG